MSVSVDPNVLVNVPIVEVTVTVVCAAPEIVPQRKPILSIMLPTKANMPTAIIPVGHRMVSRCDGDAVPAFGQPNTVGLVSREVPPGNVPHIIWNPETYPFACLCATTPTSA